MSPRGTARPQAAGFTLLEMLLVLACIAALAALATPVANHLSRRALSLRCINNLRQIGMAVNLYAQDHDLRMPALVNVMSKDPDAQTLDNVIFPMDDPAESHPVLRCPADHRRLFEESGTSYFWNQTVNDQPLASIFSVMGGGNKAQIPLVSDKEGFHADQINKVNVLFVDGRVGKELTFTTKPTSRR
ncbi:MAG: prepilin-type N-terminal cleavage/methylation domain-containing protein [Verrucomicrobiae bacterium]|nr:prepilin-type N-terminal cleavage/methylation domain-containing protein [Verrucomicrobiae bacterium]